MSSEKPGGLALFNQPHIRCFPILDQGFPSGLAALNQAVGSRITSGTKASGAGGIIAVGTETFFTHINTV